MAEDSKAMVELGGGLKRKHPSFTGTKGPEEWNQFVEYYENWLSSAKSNASQGEKRSWFEQCLKDSSAAWLWYNTAKRSSEWSGKGWDFVKKQAEERFGQPPTPFDVANIVAALKQSGDESVHMFHDRCAAAAWKLRESMPDLEDPANMTTETAKNQEKIFANMVTQYFLLGMRKDIRSRMSATSCVTSKDYLRTALLIEKHERAEVVSKSFMSSSTVALISHQDDEEEGDPYNVAASRGARGTRRSRGGRSGQGQTRGASGGEQQKKPGIGNGCKICWNKNHFDDTHWGGECPYNPESNQFVPRGRGGSGRRTQRSGGRGRGGARGGAGRGGSYSVSDLQGALEVIGAWKASTVPSGATLTELEDGKQSQFPSLNIGSLKVTDITDSIQNQHYF